jgi:hypothetical protein
MLLEQTYIYSEYLIKHSIFGRMNNIEKSDCLFLGLLNSIRTLVIVDVPGLEQHFEVDRLKQFFKETQKMLLSIEKVLQMLKILLALQISDKVL